VPYCQNTLLLTDFLAILPTFLMVDGGKLPSPTAVANNNMIMADL